MVEPLLGLSGNCTYNKLRVNLFKENTGKTCPLKRVIYLLFNLVLIIILMVK